MDRLEESLTGVGTLPALSPGDLATITIGIKQMTREERMRLYGAIIALGAQRLLLDYLSDVRVWEIAREVQASATTWLLTTGTTEADLMRRRRRRGLGEQSSGTQDSDADRFEDALDSYDKAMVHFALGLETEDSDASRDLIRLAQVDIIRAERLMNLVGGAVRARTAWQEWSEEITKQREEIADALA